MPNRIIKETIRTSKKINALSDFQFRLWTYLVTYVDDYGRGSADPEILKGFVFPRRKRTTESDIEQALKGLAAAGCIFLYEVDGESYFEFPNWGAHQRIQAKKPKFPEPITDSRKPTVTHGEPPLEYNPIQSESEYKSKENITPSLDEIKEFCKGTDTDPESFFNYYEANGWKTAAGLPIVNWKAKLKSWIKNERPKAADKKGKPSTFDLQEIEAQDYFSQGDAK